MKQRIIALWRRLYTRETVLYVVFGLLTTAVDFAAYNAVFQPLQHVTGKLSANLIANALAWCAAVAFAYVVNKKWVFCSKTETRRALWREIGQFVGSRVLSLIVSEVGMFALVSGVHLNENLSKAITSVAVLIINYVFMKWVVFKKG